MWGGYTGPGGKTIIATDAHASCRSGSSPTRTRRASRTRSTRSWPTTRRTGSPRRRVGGPRRGGLPGADRHPGLRRADPGDLAAFDGATVLPTREGGSGPEAAIAATIGRPLVFLGVGLPDDQIHAPNEKVTLSMLFRGAEAAANLWAEFAALGRAGLAG